MRLSQIRKCVTFKYKNVSFSNTRMCHRNVSLLNTKTLQVSNTKNVPFSNMKNVPFSNTNVTYFYIKRHAIALKM